MSRGIVLTVILATMLATSGCSTLSSLWPWGGPDLPEPAELPDPRDEGGWDWLPGLPDWDLPDVDLWPFGPEWEGPTPDLAQGVAVVDSEAVASFYQRAQGFYGRLAGRRFNTISTYRDPFLREFFRTEQAHADYYADLTQALRMANFEQNTPVALDVLELRLEGPGRAVVRTRIVGENDLPLRWWETELVREDRWEGSDGAWWIGPGAI